MCYYLEIRLKEYGSELIEVVDNGSGVEETNFQALSKLYRVLLVVEYFSNQDYTINVYLA